MMGTSFKTPTVVASATGDPIPNNEIATATDNSKKFDDPIIPFGAEISKGKFKSFGVPKEITKMKNVWIVRGTAINKISNGFLRIVGP